MLNTLGLGAGFGPLTNVFNDSALSLLSRSRSFSVCARFLRRGRGEREWWWVGFPPSRPDPTPVVVLAPEPRPRPGLGAEPPPPRRTPMAPMIPFLTLVALVPAPAFARGSFAAAAVAVIVAEPGLCAGETSAGERREAEASAGDVEGLALELVIAGEKLNFESLFPNSARNPPFRLEGDEGEASMCMKL